MDSLRSAGELAREGKLSEALTRLDTERFNAERRIAAELLRAELFEHLGEHQKARSIVQRLLRTRELTDTERSLCYYVSGRLLAEQNLYESAVEHLQKSAVLVVALVEPDSVLQPYMISTEIVSALPDVRSGSGVDDITVPLHGKLMPTIERIEREMIKAALQEHQGKVDEAAKALGISRKGLYLKRHRFGL